MTVARGASMPHGAIRAVRPIREIRVLRVLGPPREHDSGTSRDLTNHRPELGLPQSALHVLRYKQCISDRRDLLGLPPRRLERGELSLERLALDLVVQRHL